MLALRGKGTLTKYTDELHPLMDTVMYIHDVNSKKHPFMSYQRCPETSDALPDTCLDSIYRHLLAYLADKKDDEYGTHMESIACRMWMFITIFYRHNNPKYNIHTHEYLIHTTKDSVVDILNKYNKTYNESINPLYVHFAAEPLISLYKTLNSKDLSSIQLSFEEGDTNTTKHVRHLQVFQTLLHSILLHDRYTDPLTDEDLLHNIHLVDLAFYHLLYSFYYFKLK